MAEFAKSAWCVLTGFAVAAEIDLLAGARFFVGPIISLWAKGVILLK
jgi:hypothetical protein